jgi:hypothetical protein
MLSLKAILRNAPRPIHLGARDVSVSGITRTIKPRKGCIVFSGETRTVRDAKGVRILSPKQREYKTTIEVYDKGKVKVECTCDQHWAFWEVALYEQGSADIKHSNGKQPNTTNPRKIAGCCKHVVALATKLGSKVGI